MKRMLFLLACVLSGGLSFAQDAPIRLEHSNTTDVKDASGWDKVISSWDYVLLENIPGMEVEEVKNFHIGKDYIVMQARVNQNTEYYCFKWNGELLGRLGAFGLGEKEYMNVNSVWLDEERKRFTVYDPMILKKSVTYALDDTAFISSAPVKKSIFYYLRGLYPLDENRYLGYTACGRNKACYFLTDSLISKIDTLMIHPASFPMGYVDFSLHPVSYRDGRYTLQAPLNDTIYVYDKGELRPRFVMASHPAVPLGYRPTGDDYLTQVAEVEKNHGCVTKSGIFETAGWFVITDAQGGLYYHKPSERAYYLYQDMEARGDLIYPKDLWAEYDGRLVGIMSAEELLALKEKLEQKGVDCSPKMKQLFASVKKGMSPVLIFYTLKD